MLHLLLAMMLAPPGGSIGNVREILRDPIQGPTPVSDKYLIPERTADCATAEEIQRARAEIIKGYEPECMLPRKKADEKPH